MPSNSATAAIIQARMGSSRFPGKVLRPLGGERTVLGWVVRAAQAIPGVDKVVVATSSSPQDDQIADWCRLAGIACHRGSEDDVLARFLLAAEAEGARTALRLTADCPFLDPGVCGQILELFHQSGVRYASNIEPPSWPDGLDCEVLDVAALREAAAESRRPFEREHVTPFLRQNPDRYGSANLTCPLPGLERHRWTLDTPDDHAFLDRLAAHLPPDRPPAYVDVLRLMRIQPELAERKMEPPRDEGSRISRTREGSPHHYGYARSQELLAKAETVIPLGSQTFSKSRIQFPWPDAPMFLTKGRGGLVWDVDGNEYVDLMSGLLPIILGYCDPDIDDAVRRQLQRGISFSLSTRLEAELAERLVAMVPSAEMVRFGKNGTDATSAAIRLARAFTGRDHVLACGYHGWQDWYIGATTRSKGVPPSVRSLTRMVPYNDTAALEAAFADLDGMVAAVIMEPMSATEPGPGYLEDVKRIAHANGALLVFDEVITGFRFANGGAQERFGVTPDLSSLGKALGNGMPISAVVGRADVMREMEEVFFSGTFGGEALSLAAAIAVVDKLQREPVVATLWENGRLLADAVNECIEAHGLADVVQLLGADPWKIVKWNRNGDSSAEAIKTFVLREMLRRGVLLNVSHNISYAHNSAELARVVAAWDESLGLLAEELRRGGLDDRLTVAPIRPVFAVRST